MGRKFSTVDWAYGSNIYEVNIRQFSESGTFAAFSKHLPRLKAMGIRILWFMPVTPISVEGSQGALGSYYACSSYTGINTEFGNAHDFRQLVKEAHDLGFKVIIDWVANHTGLDHEWTIAHPEWYMQDAAGNFTEENGWLDVIDLNFSNAEMRAAMTGAMQYWVREFDIDGFRCDMAHLVPLDFWDQARTACETLKPLFWLGECEVVEYHDVFDATYAWWWMHVSEDYRKGTATLEELRDVLHAYTRYPPGAIKLFFTSNHDENSWNGTDIEKYGETALAWAVFVNTWAGMPLLYTGQEIPNDRRLKFFDKDPINWAQPLQREAFYTKLLSLRATNAALTHGETFVLPSEHGNELMAFLRRKEKQVVLVLLNFSKEDKLRIRVQHEWLKGSFINLFSELQFVFNADEEFELQAGEYIIYAK